MDNFSGYAVAVTAIVQLIIKALDLAEKVRARREAKKGKPMKAYRGIDHPAVAAVRCPYCGSAEGIPCKRRVDSLRSGVPYVETHLARAKKYEQSIAAKNDEKS